MPPLLAALLMIELGCTLSIIESIDHNMEWNRYTSCSNSWYHGRIGQKWNPILHKRLGAGTFVWPSNYNKRPMYY
jgi:hypothetical protein